MLSGVRIRNDYGEDIDIFAFDSRIEEKGYHLIDIDGIGPPPADINYTNYAVIDGGIFHASRSQVRNIVLTVEYNLDSISCERTVQQLRRRLNRVVLPKGPVRVYLYDEGSMDMWIDGYVETNEPSIFSKNPQVQISILCVDPYFNGRSRITHQIENQSTLSLDYEGDAPTGFEVFFNFDTTFRNWVEVRNRGEDPPTTIRSRSSDESFSAGRSVRINTHPGSKDVVLRSPSGSFIRRLLGETQVTNGWPSIFPGNNELQLRTSAGSSSFTATVRYYEKFGGF